ncbi:uncharacterized protein LOC120639900 [Panicum virgatum]|uniref:KIB1-4 beta-propeller domain-containing protein n=1 Tax=Panicum virgatum TaxID=38727 RepID=A0A8T0QIT0_PANVG|nr:uncharacterized protein LOC120639900 [Panicum virgatum]KAG2570626.1 hypothetical protein PVAP13_7KG035500 [Panicum virgatum]
MLGHVVIGSNGGWLVTADEQGGLRMANPATGERADLPAITTIPFLNLVGRRWFFLDVEPFVQIRFGGPPPPEDKHWGPHPPRTYTLTAAQMRQSFYRKVVLSASPRPGSYAAMVITDRQIGAPAFATAEDPAWRMARSPDGVEDAIHHDGRFYSITYAGRIEAWRRNDETGEFTSRVVAPRLVYEDKHLRRKYLAASPDGRLMAVLKRSMEVEQQYHCKITRVSFEVRVLNQASGRWEVAADIGDAAVFVGVNSTVCVSTREHPGIAAGCIYFTDDEVGGACLRKEHGASYNQRSRGYGEPDDTELRETGVYSLKAGEGNE